MRGRHRFDDSSSLAQKCETNEQDYQNGGNAEHQDALIAIAHLRGLLWIRMRNFRPVERGRRPPAIQSSGKGGGVENFRQGCRVFGFSGDGDRLLIDVDGLRPDGRRQQAGQFRHDVDIALVAAAVIVDELDAGAVVFGPLIEHRRPARLSADFRISAASTSSIADRALLIVEPGSPGRGEGDSENDVGMNRARVRMVRFRRVRDLRTASARRQLGPVRRQRRAREKRQQSAAAEGWRPAVPEARCWREDAVRRAPGRARGKAVTGTRPKTRARGTLAIHFHDARFIFGISEEFRGRLAVKLQRGVQRGGRKGEPGERNTGILKQMAIGGQRGISHHAQQHVSRR